MCLYFPLASVPVRHWHAGGVCVPAHPRRGQDSAGAAAEPGNAHKVSQPTWKTSSRHRESALSRSVAVFFFKNGRPLTNVPSRPSLWGTSVLWPDAAFGAALRWSEEEWWVKKKRKRKRKASLESFARCCGSKGTWMHPFTDWELLNVAVPQES